MELEVVGVRVGSPLGAPCPSYVVRAGGTTIRLDCGPGALDALWRSGAIGALDAILISHMHLDHMLDLAVLCTPVTRLALEHRFGARDPLALHVPAGRGPAVLIAVVEALGADRSRLDEAFALREYAPDDTVAFGEVRATFVRTAHPEPCFAPRLTDGEATLVYGADGAATPALAAHAEGADLLLLEATYLDDGPEVEQLGHMTGAQAGRLAREAGAGRLVLTHVMPWPEENAENVRRARAAFGGPVDLAEPGGVYAT
jgi:ribonuclease BN (tRNA processing enzyme)